MRVVIMNEELAKRLNFMQGQSRALDGLNKLGLGKDGKMPDINQLKELLSRVKPVTSEDYLKDPNNQPIDNEGGLLIVPDPGFVFKTKEVKTGVKFFINMASHPIIDKPETKEMVEVDNEQAVRIPMSVGNIREDFDNKHDPCKVVDCIINPDVCRELKKKSDKELLSFFSDILLAYMQQKHGVELSAQDFRLPKLTYKGSYVDFQRVKAKKKPKIDVLSHQTEKNSEPAINPPKDAFLSDDAIGGPRTPEWSLKLIDMDDEEVEFDGFNLNQQECKGVLLTIDLPLLITGRHINLQVSQSVVAVSCGKIYAIKIKVPLLLDAEKTESVFLTKTRQLYVKVLARTIDVEVNELDEGFGSLTEKEKRDSLLESNYKKVQEKQIELKSELLSDIF